MGKFLHTFFSPLDFLRAVPQVWDGFQINIKMMVVAESLVLVLALLVAIVRGLPGRRRLRSARLAIVYTDIFRGTPLILVIFMILGFSTLSIAGLSSQSLFVNGVVALTLVYTAYVTEVYRAGIESVHPSQRMAARSLGLSYAQSLRHVVLPQAIRRVIPPLLNDFIGLQKDTALITVIGVTEAVAQANFYSTDYFNYAGLHGRGGLLHHPHDPARALHRPPDQGARAPRAGAGGVSGENGSFVSLEGVSKRFGELEVLHGIDLAVDLHQVVCLIGASGSGKSTLLRCINLLEQVDAGTIVVDGQTVTGAKVDVNALRQKIGIVFQAYNLFPHMTVLAERHARPDPHGAGSRARGASDEARELLAQHRARGQGGRVSGPPLRRPAAARRDRARARDEPEPHAARRDHERARPAARRRGAGPRARRSRGRG